MSYHSLFVKVAEELDRIAERLDKLESSQSKEEEEKSPLEKRLAGISFYSEAQKNAYRNGANWLLDELERYQKTHLFTAGPFFIDYAKILTGNK